MRVRLKGGSSRHGAQQVVGKRSLCVPGAFNPLCEGGEKLLSSLYRGRNRGSERSSSLSKARQQMAI